MRSRRGACVAIRRQSPTFQRRDDVRHPLLKKDATLHAKWHCAVGQIYYDEVDDGPPPGTLLYIKPSLSGDEPSDVRNYVVDHPKFPHESTADQFFSESQFES